MTQVADRPASCARCGFSSRGPGAFLAVRPALWAETKRYCRRCWRRHFKRRNTLVMVSLGLGLMMGVTIFVISPAVPLSTSSIGLAWFAVNLMLVTLVWPLLAAIHELGHALAAKAVGMRVFRVNVGYGRTWLIRRVAGVDLHINALLFLGGLTYAGHVERSYLRVRQAVYVAGGPAANLLLAGALELASGRPGMWESLDRLFQGPAFLQALLLGNVLVACLSLLPMRASTAAGANTTDGMKLLALLKVPPAFVEATLLNQWILASTFALRDEDFPLAEEQAAKGLALSPGHPALLNNLGIAKLGKLEFEAARDLFREVLRIHEGTDHPGKALQIAESLNNIAYANVLIGGRENLREADAHSSRACELVPREPGYEETRGCVLVEMRRYEEGRGWLERSTEAVTGAQGTAIHHAYLALANARLGDAAAAEEHVRRAGAKVGRHPLAERTLARLNEADPPVFETDETAAAAHDMPATGDMEATAPVPPKSWQAVLRGFLLAPLASALLQGLIMLSPGAAIMTLIFAYPLALLLGLPGYLLFRRMRWLKPWQVIAAGGTLGAAVALIVFLGTGQGAVSAPTLLAVGLFTLHGAVVAAVFWWIAIGTRARVPTDSADAIPG